MLLFITNPDTLPQESIHNRKSIEIYLLQVMKFIIVNQYIHMPTNSPCSGPECSIIPLPADVECELPFPLRATLGYPGLPSSPE